MSIQYYCPNCGQEQPLNRNIKGQTWIYTCCCREEEKREQERKGKEVPHAIPISVQ